MHHNIRPPECQELRGSLSYTQRTSDAWGVLWPWRLVLVLTPFVLLMNNSERRALRVGRTVYLICPWVSAISRSSLLAVATLMVMRVLSKCALSKSESELYRSQSRSSNWLRGRLLRGRGKCFENRENLRTILTTTQSSNHQRSRHEKK